MHPCEWARALATEAYRKHLDSMLDDRRLDTHLTQLSELSCSPACSFSGTLHVRIDAMGPSKFRCPRHIESAKMWAHYRRPTLHTVGCIIEGLLEVYLVADQDLFKGSDMDITVLAYCLDLAKQELEARGIHEMPAHVSVNYGNTGKA